MALREPRGALQIPPLRFAPVGMTRREGIISGRSATGIDRLRLVACAKTADPSTSAGMTRGEGIVSGRSATGIDRLRFVAYAKTADPSTSAGMTILERPE
jgi:hypothetical protein